MCEELELLYDCSPFDFSKRLPKHSFKQVNPKKPINFKILWEVAIPISYKGVGSHPISKVDVSTPWAIHFLKRWGRPPTLKV